MRPIGLGVAVLLFLVPGCGHLGHGEERAGRTVALAWQVVAETERMLDETGEDEETRDERVISAVDDVQVRLGQAQQVLQIWQEEGVGRAGWFTIAPCLASSLKSLQRALRRAGLREPDLLDQAHAMADEFAGDGCRETRDRRREDREEVAAARRRAAEAGLYASTTAEPGEPDSETDIGADEERPESPIAPEVEPGAVAAVSHVAEAPRGDPPEHQRRRGHRGEVGQNLSRPEPERD